MWLAGLKAPTNKRFFFFFLFVAFFPFFLQQNIHITSIQHNTLPRILCRRTLTPRSSRGFSMARGISLLLRFSMGREIPLLVRFSKKTDFKGGTLIPVDSSPTDSVCVVQVSVTMLPSSSPSALSRGGAVSAGTARGSDECKSKWNRYHAAETSLPSHKVSTVHFVASLTRPFPIDYILRPCFVLA